MLYMQVVKSKSYGFMEIKIFNFLTKNVSYLILGLYEMINIHKTYCGLKKKKKRQGQRG